LEKFLAFAASARGCAGDLAIGQEDVASRARHESPDLDQSTPNRVFWGNTRLHAASSIDPGMIGTTPGPAEAVSLAGARRCAPGPARMPGPCARSTS
jgi:hypothetical protein